jgi:hypothetical protein
MFSATAERNPTDLVVAGQPNRDQQNLGGHSFSGVDLADDAAAGFALFLQVAGSREKHPMHIESMFQHCRSRHSLPHCL